MTRFRPSPFVLTTFGAVLLGGSVAAFCALGGTDPFTAADSELSTPQLLNVLGFITGAVLLIVGGRRSHRTQTVRQSRRALLSVVATLQSLKHGPYRATPAATPHLDALLQLAWQRDNDIAAVNPGVES